MRTLPAMVLLMAVIASTAKAEERKYVVMLAHAPKAFVTAGEPGLPPGGLLSAEIIRQDYFDRINPDLLSFAEYWEEISYGDVTVSGQAFEWVTLPWPFEPDGPNAPARSSPEDFIDLFDADDALCPNAPLVGGLYNYGAGEVFCDCTTLGDNTTDITRDKCGALVIIDLIGNPNPRPFEPTRGPGLVDFPTVGVNVWTPGERFIDLDNDLRWDGIDEKNDMLCHGAEGCQGICSGFICSDLSHYCQTDADCPPDVGCMRGSLNIKACSADEQCGARYCAGTTTPCGGAGDAACPDGVACLEPETCGDRGTCMGLFCSGTSTPCFDFGATCDGGGVCVFGTGSGRSCVSTADCLIPGEPIEVCVPPGPRGCNSPGCGDLSMPAIDFSGDGDFTSSACNPLNFIPCAEDADCGVGRSCIAVESFGEIVRMCDPLVLMPCDPTEDAEDGSNPSCDPGLICGGAGVLFQQDTNYCVSQPRGSTDLVAPLCYTEAPEESLPPCCGPNLDTANDPCFTEGVALCSDYPTLSVCTGAPAPGEVCCRNEPAGISCGNPTLCCEFDDFDGNNNVNVVEPFEDYLVRWEPAAQSVGGAWTRVSREYIKNNYPGDVIGLLNRVGNGYYDPPDMFFDHLDADEQPVSTKMQQDAGTNRFTWAIPKPGTYLPYVNHTNEPSWFDSWWVQRYGSTPPEWPGAASGMPASPNGVRMISFDPQAPNPDILADTEDRRWFAANRGGWNGFGRGSSLDEPNIQFDVGGNAWDSQILPEEEFGYYDGWVEHDDLASSRYHREGDKRLGEITSPTEDTVLLPGSNTPYTAIFGADVGVHDPNQLSDGGDFQCVAAGPGAINIHGEKGYDAGDVCLVEWLTWRRDGKSPTSTRMWEIENGPYHPYEGTSAIAAGYVPLGRCTSDTACTTDANCGARESCDLSIQQCNLSVVCRNDLDCPGTYSCYRPLQGVGFRDYNLDGMIDQGEVRPELSENYSVDSNPTTPNDGTASDYPFNRTRLTEDAVEALDPSVDWDNFANENFVGHGRNCELSSDPCTVDSDCLYNGSCVSNTCCYPNMDNGCYGNCRFLVEDRIVSGIVIVPGGSYSDINRFPRAPGLNAPIHTEDTPFTPYFTDLVICTNCRDEPSAVGYSAHEMLHSWEGYPDLYDYDVFDEPGTNIINCPMGFWDIMERHAVGLIHPSPPLKEVYSGWIDPVNLKTALTPGVETTLFLPPAELVRDDSYYYLQNDVVDSSGALSGERYYFWAAGSGADSVFPGTGMLMMKTNDYQANTEALALQQRTDPFNFRIVQADGRNDLLVCENPEGNTGDFGDMWPGATNATTFNFDTNPRSIWQDGRWTGLDITNVVALADGSVRLTLKWEPTNIPSLRFIDPPGGGSVGSIYRIQYETTDVYGRTDIAIYYTRSNVGIPDPSAATQIGSTRTKILPGTIRLTTNWDASGLEDGLYYLFAKLTPDTTPVPPPDGPEIRFTEPLPNRNNGGNGTVTGISLSPQSRLETWVIEYVDPANEEWVVSGSLTQPLPEPPAQPTNDMIATTGVPYTSRDGVLAFTIVSGTAPFELGDTYTFKTTGITKFSTSLRVEDGKVVTGPKAVIDAVVDGQTPGTPLSGQVELQVNFDARRSTDPEGLPLTFDWDFGDGAVGTGSQTSHTYTQGGVFTVILRATNTVPQTGVDTVDVTVINNSPSAVISASPTSGPSPLSVAFTAVGSSDVETTNPGDLTYQWDFGDGTAANPQGTPGVGFLSTTHFYSDQEDGTPCTSQNPCLFTATLTVSDPGGASSDASIEISVGNSSPVAVITAVPASGQSPLDVVFNASGSTDVDGDTITVSWDFGDGATAQYPITGPPGETNGDVPHTYTLPAGATLGSFQPKATLSDGRGGFTNWTGPSITVTAPVAGSSDPIAAFDFDPAPPFTVGQEFKVVSTSRDRPNAATTLIHTWSFGDGTADVQGTAREVTHTYTAANESGYLVTLKVKDPEGNEAQLSKTAKVVAEATDGGDDTTTENQAPVASFVVNTNGAPVTEGSLVQFDAADSQDPEGGVLRYRWNFGDGSPVESGTGSSFAVRTHRYTSAGTYLVLLTVTDESNASDDVTVNVVVLPTVVNRPPVAVLADGPRSGPAPFTVQLNGQLSFDPDNDPLSFTFEFSGGDGSEDEIIEGSAVVSKTFEKEGLYNVVMRVDDGNVAPEEIPFVEAEIRVTSPVTGSEPTPGTEVPEEHPSAGSHTQRPTGAFCGFGMLPAFFASLLGLGMMRLARRRF